MNTSDYAARHEEFKRRKLALNMMRGNPSKAQLDLSSGLLTCLGDGDCLSEDGIDCRNYGILDGLPEMKRIFADILELEPDEIIVGGNSSLALMFDNVASNMARGVREDVPWAAQGKVKFLCPSPGYDRHFAVCEYFHIEMIPVAMTDSGPDVDEVERLVSSDPSVKGIWCVPYFSNPTGAVYSGETVRRLAALKPAAGDFRIYWDCAYVIHHLTGGRRRIPNIVRECEKAGSPHMPMVFTSFSKVSFPGAAVTCIASSAENCAYIKKRLRVQTIGPDKMRQLMHVRFFGGAEGVCAHMEKHAAILRPKFALVETMLRENLSGLDGCDWMTPEGGYFVSVNTPPGLAKRVAALCAEAGVALTPVGATFPYRLDPQDRNLRLAPSFPPLDELQPAMEVFCNAVLLAAEERASLL
ncbi:MAG: aminotransferase class I/II-fold pyridoxal phosphate-dependent enzyme [Oscillospiraceae bacterium]|nr:aminotransferase class I/II-fold pyridoxal phosphate-dependent enzyme [Oscillospiraceae bacterium]